jgi:hypothetical protein
MQGLGLAALTCGVGAGPLLGGLVGIGHYMNKANIGHKLGNFATIDLASNIEQNANLANNDLSQIARYGPSGLAKMPIAELGNLKQSLEHFSMPSVPKLKDLPLLHESLGKIVSLKDIEGLTLGLPSMTAASGKKYSTQVLYNSDFIKKLKKVSRNLGTPYLTANTNNINNTSLNSRVTSYA